MLIVAGVALAYPSVVSDAIGLGLVVVALALQALRRPAATAASR